MGNICRSPTGEGVMKHHVVKRGLEDRIEVDSAGTHAYHIGEQPDPRSIQEALRHGVDLRDQRARQVQQTDFDRFDYVIAMDQYNFDLLEEQCPTDKRNRLHIMPQFAPHLGEDEVPDPYYGGAQGFPNVFRIVEESVQGLLDHIEREHFNGPR
jgi:protein-tyrosine phosphatase